jgi:hypothetical protein
LAWSSQAKAKPTRFVTSEEHLNGHFDKPVKDLCWDSLYSRYRIIAFSFSLYRILFYLVFADFGYTNHHAWWFSVSLNLDLGFGSMGFQTV